MQKHSHLLAAWLFAGLAASALSAAEPEAAGPNAGKPDAAQIAFFEKKVRPILVDRCQDCHSEDAAESELQVDSLAAMLEGGIRGPAIVLGQPSKSLLISAINHSDKLLMPPKEKLSRADIAAITEWIRVGAPWPNSEKVKPSPHKKKSHPTGPLFTEEEKNFWSFQPLVKQSPPAVKNANWAASPLDAFVLAKLEAAGLHPAPAADKRTLLRRVTFDLTGLPPTPEEVQAFLQDNSPQALATVIDRLLDSPRYGERWGRYWLDIARYADSNGLDENLAYANAFRYRDYVIAAFNKDKPYDRFVKEQLAGDLLTQNADPETRFEGLTATGFLSVGAKMLAEDDPVKMQMDIVDEQIDTIGRAFMGLTLGCARCHAHKFDPIPTEDYYSLAGILKSTKTMENFSVVARWQERPLATPEQLAQRDAILQKAAAKQSQIDQLVQLSNNKLLAASRAHVGDYLLAAEQLRRHDRFVSQLKSVGAEKDAALPEGAVLIEAENYVRGNLLKDSSNYGKGIGVILNGGAYPNFAEYDLTFPSAGQRQLEIRYAAAAARPVQLLINGEPVRTDAAGKATGSWTPETQTWEVQGVFHFTEGKNTIRLELSGQAPFPHIDKLLLTSLANAPKPLARIQPPNKEGSKEGGFAPKPEFVRQWVAYLVKAAEDDASPFAAWNQLAASGPDDLLLVRLASLYTSLFREIDRDWAAFSKTEAGKNAKRFSEPNREALRQVLYAAEGPFRLPKDVESSYAADVREQLAARRAEKKTLDDSLPAFPQVMAVSEGEPQDVEIHIRGSHRSLGQKVPRQFLRLFAGEHQPPIDNQRSGRLELANWLASAKHPLTARVMVNRIWQGHFGEGLVRSPDNFGRLGERPTHPALLDWLTVRFLEEGWSIKTLHRMIMLSSTYQMSTAFDAQAMQQDPENRLLWRMNRRRLEAEAIRDSVLAVSGALELEMGGSMLPTANRKYVTSTANVDPVAYETNRRSVYMPIVRSALYDVFRAFDFADPSVLSGKRINTTVAPQALFMMNGKVVNDQMRAWSKHLLAEAELTDPQRIEKAYQRALSRAASEQEIKQSLAYIGQYASAVEAKGKPAEEGRQRAWESFCRVLIASNEFMYVE